MNSIAALRPTPATPASIPGQPLIVVGTRVSTILHNRGEGFVIAIHGEQQPDTVRSLGGVGMMGGRAEFNIVFLSGSFSRRLPECILRGVQWRLLDLSRQRGRDRRGGRPRRGRQAAARDRRRRCRCGPRDRTRPASLSPGASALRQGDERYSGKLAAANIRVELRCAFPGVKFSVRVPLHGSILVRWMSGPTRQEVEAIGSRYQGGHFDGMEDIYRSVRSPWCEVFGTADYVSCSREEG